MSGHWPPEWDSPADELSGESLDPGLQAQLAEVTAFLAAVPQPVLPPDIEARISASIVAEAESPGTRSEVADLSTFVRRSRWRRLQSGKVLAPVAACLVLAVAGYFASLAHDSSGNRFSANSAVNSTAGGATSLQGQSAVPAAAPNALRYGITAAGEQNRSVSAAASAMPSSSARRVTVTSSGTKYQAATLAAQARAELGTYNAALSAQNAEPHAPASYSAPSAATTSGAWAAYSTASAPLLGCVDHFTGGAQPRLLDRGTYQGTPAYVIVGKSQIWVVGLGCTASHPELLASALLAG
jgi:hypothetical protein